MLIISYSEQINGSKHAQKERQYLISIGVNEHHNNELSEIRIRNIHDLTYTALIFVVTSWKGWIIVNIWTYITRLANYALSNTPNLPDKEQRTAEQIFSKTKTNVNIKHFKPFECPTYVLQNYNKTHHPQIERKSQSWHISRKFLPQHGRDISLVINIYT